MEVTVMKPNKTAERQDEVLTFEQIKNRVGKGWALIKDPVFNGSIFIKGALIYYSADPDEAYEELRITKEKDVFFLHCVERDPNVIYML